MTRHTLFATLLLCLALVGCGRKQASDKTLVAVSVPAQQWLVEQIAGSDFEVVTLLEGNADPETFEPSVRTRTSLDNASAIVLTGYLPFEEKLDETLPETVRRVRGSEGIELIYGTHGHDHGHGQDHGDHHHDGKQPDPHTWTSLRNLAMMAQNMNVLLCELNPDSAEVYSARTKTLVESINEADSAVAAKLAKAPSKAFAVWHPSLSYFARDYGLEQIAVGFENKEASPAHLAEVIEEAKEDGVRVLVVQSQYDTRQTKSLNQALGTRMAAFNPLDKNPVKSLTDIADELAR